MKRLNELCGIALRKISRSDEEHCAGNSIETDINTVDAVQRMDMLEQKMNQMLEQFSHFVHVNSSYGRTMQMYRQGECFTIVNGSVKSSVSGKDITYSKKDDFLKQMVENVTGIVGMRETVSSKPRSLKYTWTSLFLLGVAATVYFTYKTCEEYLDQPSATKVFMNGSSVYYFPPIRLCPKQWLDAQTAFSSGLTEDALKYSLGYVKCYTGYHNYTPTGRSQFLQYYHSHNFSSLLDYYLSISLNPITTYSDDLFSNTRNSVWLSDANATYMGKTFQDCMVCYTYSMAPVDLSWSSSMVIKVKFNDQTGGFLPNGTGTWVHIGDDLTLLSSIVPGVFVPSYTRNGIMVNARRFVALSTRGRGKCASVRKSGPPYSSDSCIATCQNEMKRDILGCELFWLTSTDTAGPPSKYCHYSKNAELQYGALSHTERDACFRKCPESCDQMLYQITLQWQEGTPSDNDNENYIELEFDHNSIYDGGLFTLIEVSTYSFADLVTNVGGAFGLFVGGTTMTLVQILMFIVNYIYRKGNYSNGKT